MPSPQSDQDFQNPATATATDLSLTAAGSAPSDETKGACALPDGTEGAGRQGEMQNTSVSSGRPSPETSPSACSVYYILDVVPYIVPAAHREVRRLLAARSSRLGLVHSSLHI